MPDFDQALDGPILKTDIFPFPLISSTPTGSPSKSELTCSQISFVTATPPGATTLYSLLAVEEYCELGLVAQPLVKLFDDALNRVGNAKLFAAPLQQSQIFRRNIKPLQKRLGIQ
jgi:hypothetical protein